MIRPVTHRVCGACASVPEPAAACRQDVQCRMEFKDHFSRLAAEYSAFRPTYPSGIFEYLAGVCRQRQLAWDCACGNGQATVSLAGHFQQVIGTDASEKQIAAAVPHSGITYRVASGERSGLASSSVDLVTVAQALHWLDLPLFFAEVARVLRPGGILAVWTYGPLHIEGTETDRLIQDFYSAIVGPYWPPERKLVDAGYQGIAFPFRPLEPPPFDMRERWNRDRLLGYVRTWSATARYVERNALDPVVALEDRLASGWPDRESPREILWPLTLRVSCKD